MTGCMVGAVQNGYAVFAALTAIRVLKDQQLPHSRCVVIIEACEESGSGDLPLYLDALSEHVGKPSLVICLDFGAGNYEQLWCTTSLRGMVCGTLFILKEAVGLRLFYCGGRESASCFDRVR